MKETLNFIQEHWIAISALLGLIISRVIPSEKNYDLARKGLDLLDLIIPNLKKGGGRHRNKTIILTFFLLAGLSSYAQNNVAGKAFASYNVTDTTAAQTYRSTLQTNNGNAGLLYFDKTRNKWRVWNGSAYVDLISSGTTVNGSNGNVKVGSNIEWGGPLTKNTSVNGAGFSYTLGTGASRLSTYSINTSGNITINSSTSDISITSGNTVYLEANLGASYSNVNFGSGIAFEIGGAGFFDISTGSGQHVRLSTSSGQWFFKQSFTQTATTAPLNLIGTGSDPSGTADGDFIFNTTGSDALKFRKNGTINTILQGTAANLGASNRILLTSGTNGDVTTDAGFTYSASNLTAAGITLSGLPGTDNTNTSVLCRDPATGALELRTVASITGTPAGANTEVQFNNSGAFGASSSFIWNGSQVGVGGTLYGTTSLLPVGNYTIVNANRTGANGYDMNIAAGDVSSGNGNGGNVYFETGTPSGTGVNGVMRFYFVNDHLEASTPAIGTLSLKGYNSSTIVGEDIKIEGGSPSTGNNAGGDIFLLPGAGTGTGNNGRLYIEDGANENMGTATLVGGTVTVNNTMITANTRIFYSVQTAGGTQGFLSTTRVAGTSFTITSTSGTETSTIVWLLVEPD